MLFDNNTAPPPSQSPYPYIPHINTSIAGKAGYASRQLAKKSIVGVGKSAWWLGEKATQAGLATSRELGGIGLTSARVFGSGVFGLSSFTLGAIGKSLTYDDWRNPIGKVAKGAFKLASNLVDYEASHQLENRLSRFKLTNKGKVAVIGAAIAGALMNTSNQLTSRGMGITDANMTTATPDYTAPNYDLLNNAGATGDLVFALHKNRHG